MSPRATRRADALGLEANMRRFSPIPSPTMSKRSPHARMDRTKSELTGFPIGRFSPICSPRVKKSKRTDEEIDIVGLEDKSNEWYINNL